MGVKESVCVRYGSVEGPKELKLDDGGGPGLWSSWTAWEIEVEGWIGL